MRNSLSKFLHLVSTLAVIALSGVMVSCKQVVFETRDECPATLVFRADPPLDGRDTRILFSLRFDGILHTATSIMAPALNSGLVFECDRSNNYISATAYYGWPDSQDWVFGGILRIPEGSMCPKAGASFVEAPFPMASEERKPFLMHFNDLYWETSVRFSGSSLPAAVLLEVTGNTDGFTLPTLEPHRGAFSFAEEVSTAGGFLMRIPRLADWGTMTYRVTGGGREWTLDVAKAVRDAGYEGGDEPFEVVCTL